MATRASLKPRGTKPQGRLAAKFASLTRENIEAHGGRLLELRGDEALVVFDSPRLALKAAVDLQARFLEATEAEPELPLGVGIGIDAGEAVAVEEGYRGGALNLAARLCSLAGPGEILTSAEVTHLAQRIPGISYQSKGRQQLKGLAPGTEAVKVFSQEGDPALRFAALRAEHGEPAATRPPAAAGGIGGGGGGGSGGTGAVLHEHEGPGPGPGARGRQCRAHRPRDR